MRKGSSYDTRFFVELFYATEAGAKKRIREILLQSKPNIISAASLSEIYELFLERSGRDVAELRLKVMQRDFQIAAVDSLIAVEAAQIRRKRPIPFADSLIAATSKILAVPCYSDDPHFRGIKGVEVRWIN